MNRDKLLWLGCAGLLALAVVVGVLTLRSPKTDPAAQAEPSASGARTGAVNSTHAEPGRTHDSTRLQTSLIREPAAKESDESGSETESFAGDLPATDAKTSREQAAEAWDSLVDQMIEQKDVAAAAQARRVKEAFDKLDKADQMDGVHRALNLLPDEQFPALFAILYDKEEDPDVLDAIFSDALNRPEEIKNPLLQELRKDREHPMFFESARILDVVEPAEATP